MFVMSRRTRLIIEQVYDNLHHALWAVVIAGLFFFVAFDVPRLPEMQARYQAQRALEIEGEHDFYCRKWGMVPGSGKHNLCMSDLQQFRRSVEKRIEDESLF
jgi:hypothetical protein